MTRTCFGLALATIAGLTIFTSTGASAQGTQLFAVLNGGSECDADGHLQDGRPGRLRLRDGHSDPGSNSEAVFRDPGAGIATPTLAHIHTGNSGVKGDIKVTLDYPDRAGATGFGVGLHHRGDVADHQSAQRTIPRAVTSTCTNTPFPDGAVRGQLF